MPSPRKQGGRAQPLVELESHRGPLGPACHVAVLEVVFGKRGDQRLQPSDVAGGAVDLLDKGVLGLDFPGQAGDGHGFSGCNCPSTGVGRGSDVRRSSAVHRAHRGTRSSEAAAALSAMGPCRTLAIHGVGHAVGPSMG